jgi:thioredoxin 1
VRGRPRRALRGGGASAAARRAAAKECRDRPIALPDWAAPPAPAEAARRGRSRPRAREDDEAAPPPEPERCAPPPGAARCSTSCSSGCPVASRRTCAHAAALRWLEHSAGVAMPASARRWSNAGLRIIDDPRFAPLFGPGSLAEAPIAATLPTAGWSPAPSTGCWSRRACVGRRLQDRARAGGEATIPAAHRARWRPMPRRCGDLPGRRIEAALLYTGRAATDSNLPVEGALSGPEPHMAVNPLHKEFAAMATKTVTDQSFATDVLGADKPVLVDFWAEWCGPCRMIAPALEEISQTSWARRSPSPSSTSTRTPTPGKYGVRGIPTMLLFKNGEPVAQKVGAAPRASSSSGWKGSSRAVRCADPVAAGRDRHPLP